MVALVSVPAAVMPGRNLTDRVLALLERVDYRRAETTEEREAIFRLRYNGVPARRRDPAQRRASVSAIASMTRAMPGSSGSTSTASWQARSACTWPRGSLRTCRPSTSSPTCCRRRSLPARPSSIRPGSSPTASPRGAIPELCYVTTRLAWLASEFFHTSLLLATVRGGASGLLPARLRPPADLRAAPLSLAHQADQPDGARLCPGARARGAALPVLPLHRLRAPDAVCPHTRRGRTALGRLRSRHRARRAERQTPAEIDCLRAGRLQACPARGRQTRSTLRSDNRGEWQMSADGTWKLVDANADRRAQVDAGIGKQPAAP